jgi:hypothetical protein
VLLFSEEYQIFWDAISSIMAVLATGMACFALIYSVKTYKKTMQTVHYGEIDKMYFEILKESLSKPHLSKGTFHRNETEILEYDIYAFILWNFLESIYDRCEEDKELQKTWYPILEVEAINHKHWIELSENKIKFKDSFLQFVEQKVFNVNVQRNCH